jgi:hypothetical protein
MDNNFAVINKEKEVAQKAKPNEPCLFTLAGREDFRDEHDRPRVLEDDSKRVFAKIVNNKRMILCNRAGDFIDPIDPFENVNTTQFRHGLSVWEFTSVSEEVFESYLRFLKTMNRVWLRKAERERQ